MADWPSTDIACALPRLCLVCGCGGDDLPDCVVVVVVNSVRSKWRGKDVVDQETD